MGCFVGDDVGANVTNKVVTLLLSNEAPDLLKIEVANLALANCVATKELKSDGDEDVVRDNGVIISNETVHS
jgi:hypothetical protein